MPMTIAVDAMGGDHAPQEVVLGALTVAREDTATRVVLVGDESAIRAVLSTAGEAPANLSIRHAGETIGMDEHPAQALRRKRGSSLVIAGQMVKSGEADATFSAGNTGAAMAIATIDIGRIPGVDRPAIATTLPTAKGRALLLDAGANVDCSPQNLVQFALLGSIYAEKVQNRTRPSVGLLNIGGEPGKGNELTKSTYGLLQSGPLNFLGNVEGKDVFEGAVDVVVCDGFAGNILLKGGDGVAELIVGTLQREIASDPQLAGALPTLTAVLKRLTHRIDYAETGGAPLLGVNGVSFIGHGRSQARAIASGIRAALAAAASGYVAAIRAALSAVEGAA